MQAKAKPRVRANQTETSVLGALSVAPMTGYALREAIRDVLGHFWSESFGQIYPTLTALERDGHVRRLGAVRTRASMFAITASGTSRLKELLAQPVRPAPPRNGLMLRLFFGRQLGAPACRALVREARADAERNLAQYQAIRLQLLNEEDSAGDHTYVLLTISAGEHSARAAITWADQAIVELAPLDSHDEGTHRPGANNAAPQPGNATEEA
jgi:DNA-binding PadR family transcriptional regulator